MRSDVGQINQNEGTLVAISGSRVLPMVSIIMLTYNRPTYIDEAIQSVVAQDYANWELVIVQDGDNHVSRDKVMQWVRRDSRIRYFHRPTVGSIGSAMNYGIKRSVGEYVAVLDDDDVWLGRGKLSSQVAFLMSNRVAAVGGGAIVVDLNGVEAMRYLKPLFSLECRRSALIANPIVHSAVMYRRTAYEAVGGYDESIREYQDWDFWLRVMHKYEVANLDDYLVRYRVWDGGSTSKKSMGNAISALRIVRRHRRKYRGYWVAMGAAIVYVIFATIPSRLRRAPTRGLSRLKKRLFNYRRAT